MIVHGFIQLEIGKKYTDKISGSQLEYHMMSYIVIREATYDELVHQAEELECLDILLNDPIGNYIYKIQTD